MYPCLNRPCLRAATYIQSSLGFLLAVLLLVSRSSAGAASVLVMSGIPTGKAELGDPLRVVSVAVELFRKLLEFSALSASQLP